jgi:hypothetical protein
MDYVLTRLHISVFFKTKDHYFWYMYVPRGDKKQGFFALGLKTFPKIINM